MRRTAARALLALLLLAACTTGRPAPATLRGDRLEVMATWSGVEQQRFEQVLAAFSRSTGTVVRYTSTSHRLPDVLTARLAAGRPPDVAFLPQPGLLQQLAARGQLVALDRATGALVAEHYAPVFRTLGEHRGRLYGVWFKAADKSLVWYDVASFERLGAVPPTTLDGLLALARRFAAAGEPAFAVAGKDAWTLSDWFEDLYLRLAGPQRYDALAGHRLPWTDPSVARTLQTMAALLAPDHLAGGVAGALRTGFEQSVEQLAARPARAAMVVEGDFVAGVVTGRTASLVGTDTDVFDLPAGPSPAPGVVAGGDVAVLLRASPAGAALLRFLATPEAAQPWAAAGGFVSPNVDLDLATYPDEISRKVARSLLEAGSDLRFDLSDLQPAVFGGSDERGLRAELRDFLVHRDVRRTCARLEAEARAAYGGTAP